MAVLDREVKYLINKAKIWRPKQDTATNHTASTNENATDTKEQSQSESVPKTMADSQTEKQSKEDQSDNIEVQNEKSEGSEESAEALNDNKAQTKTQEEEIHQEL